MENKLLGGIGIALSAVGTATQTNDFLQTLSLVITIIGGVITFIVIPLYNWYCKAKEDGKIDKKETDEAIKIVIDGKNKIDEDIDKNKKG